ncbi:MAG TPA: hypothetical protein DCW29_11370, partial [Janthinobacterium sp.]|nr:hypothetical protein [Janthinobacterium sp.]
PQLGRLFATPSERAQLDALRDGGVARPAEQAASVVAQEAAAAPPPPAAPAPVELNGIVRRSSGKSTVWLNQVPQNDAANTLGKDATLSLRLPSGRKVVLKPGQSYKADEGTVGEADGR